MNTAKSFKNKNFHRVSVSEQTVHIFLSFLILIFMYWKYWIIVAIFHPLVVHGQNGSDVILNIFGHFRGEENWE